MFRRDCLRLSDAGTGSCDVGSDAKELAELSVADRRRGLYIFTWETLFQPHARTRFMGTIFTSGQVTNVARTDSRI